MAEDKSSVNEDFDPDDEVDFDEVQEGYKDLDAGKYLFKVDEFERRDRKDGGGEFIYGEMLAVDTADPKLEEGLGSRVFEAFSLTKKSLWKLKAFAGAVDPDIVKGKTTIDKIVKAVKGRYFTATAYEDKYDPQNPNMRLKSFKSAEGWDGVNCRIENGKLIGDEPESRKKKTNGGGGGKKRSKPEDFQDDDEGGNVGGDDEEVEI